MRQSAWQDKGLGRLPSPDERDRFYPMSLVMPMPRLVPQEKTWKTGPVLNQGSQPHCVGYAWKGWLNAEPIMSRKGPPPHIIYADAQKVDEWPGEAYEGTSVRAGVKALQARRHVKSYVHANSVESLQLWSLTMGTVVIGTVWTEKMFSPDRNGFIEPQGAQIGGHATLLVGYSTEQSAFRLRNSWGREWGEGGNCWVHRDVMHDLLFVQYGDAIAAVEKIVRRRKFFFW